MGKRILLTGANGFLGKYIYRSLYDENELYTLYRSKDNSKNHLSFDLSKPVSHLPEVDLVIHAAGKAHSVPKSKKEAEAFYDVNHKGTLHLIKALELNHVLPKEFVYISTVAVYGEDSGEYITENHPAAAKDPYGKSKAIAEQELIEWCRNKNIRLSILRLPLVAGDQPPGNLGQLYTGIEKGYYKGFGPGKNRRSIVLAEDVASIIPAAAEKGGVYNLSDGQHPTFNEIEAAVAEKLGKKPPSRLPYTAGLVLAKFGDLLHFFGIKAFPLTSTKLKKLTSSLTFSDQRARSMLGWNPRVTIQHMPDHKRTTL